jgi:surface polysaccharide O-acyltransferase-like enzyme
MPKNLDLRYFTGYLGYAVLGYWLYRKDFGRHTNKIGVMLYLVGFLLTCFGTYWLTNRANDFDGRLYNGLSITACIMATGIFLAFKGFSMRESWLKKTITEISNHSFGIYLNHLLIIVPLYYQGISWRLFPPVAGIFITSVLVIAASYLLVKLVGLLPFGKKISG